MTMPLPSRPAVVDALEPRALFAATLTPGETSIKGIGDGVRQRNYQFDFTAGQYVAFAAGDRGTGAFSPKLRLFNSGHQAVRTAIGDDGAYLGYVIRTSGRYTLRLQDSDGTHAGSVDLTAFFADRTRVTQDSDDAGELVSGRRYAAGFSAGDLDAWRFDGTAGAFLRITLNQNDDTARNDYGIGLITPDGRFIDGAQYTGGLSLDQTLKQTGTYYVLVYHTVTDPANRYGLSIALVPGEQTPEDPDTQAPLAVDTPRTGDLPSGDTDVFAVPLGKNVTATLTLTRTGGSTSPDLLLLDADGRPLVEKATGKGTATFTYTTPARGTYSLAVRNRDINTGGQYRLTLTTG